MHTEPITWYTSRRVEVPLRDAAAALDDLVARGIARPRQHARVTGALAVRPVTALPGVGRRLRGWLSIPGIGAPVAVELELVAWSSSCAEIGLRPAGRAPRLRAQRYFTSAIAALRELGTSLERRAGARGDALARRAS